MQQEEILNELLDAGECSVKPERIIHARQVQRCSSIVNLRCGTPRNHTPKVKCNCNNIRFPIINACLGA